MRYKIISSENPKQKDVMQIELNQEEDNNKKIHKLIEEYQKTYRTIVFVSGGESVEKFFRNFICFSGLYN